MTFVFVVSLKAEFIIPISRLHQRSDFCDSCVCGQSQGWIYHTNFQITSDVVRFLWQLCLWSVLRLNLSYQSPDCQMQSDFCDSCLCGQSWHWIYHTSCQALLDVDRFLWQLCLWSISRLNLLYQLPGYVGCKSDFCRSCICGHWNNHSCLETEFIVPVARLCQM